MGRIVLGINAYKTFSRLFVTCSYDIIFISVDWNIETGDMFPFKKEQIVVQSIEKKLLCKA